ncbi:MAG: DUF3014 domain-containing protein [Woeseiaceae bacterium]|nr:DUF3014 domain-containing protein [Woeseiaceae bacterium]
MSQSASRWFIWVLLLAGIAAAYWYFVAHENIPIPAEFTGPATSDKYETPEPLHPLPPPGDSATDARTLVPLPPLDDSDKYFELALQDLFGDNVGDLLVDQALIEKVVATIDNLPRKAVAERIRPVGRADGNFTVAAGANEDEYELDPENFGRYTALANQLASADLDNVVETYRRFYPLLQEAYVNLGYPGKYFNDRVVEVIDHLLSTPVPTEPIRLRRPHVLYQFADPELEALSSGQKLLLRIGNDNAAKVRSFLEGLRSRIAA